MRLQRSSRNWRIECRILCTRAFSFLPVARIVAKSRRRARRTASVRNKTLLFFAPRHPNGFGFPAWRRAVSLKLENLIFNHHTRMTGHPVLTKCLGLVGARRRDV